MTIGAAAVGAKRLGGRPDVVGDRPLVRFRRLVRLRDHNAVATESVQPSAGNVNRGRLRLVCLLFPVVFADGLQHAADLFLGQLDPVVDAFRIVGIQPQFIRGHLANQFRRERLDDVVGLSAPK